MGAKIYNSDASRALIAGAGLTGADAVPQELAEKALPVIDMTPDFHRVAQLAQNSATTSGNVTLLTASATKETYITSVNLSFVKDATCDTASGVISVDTTINGVGKSLIYLSKLTLTAERAEGTVNFPIPVLIDKGATVVITGKTFTVGALSVGGNLSYFETNPKII